MSNMQFTGKLTDADFREVEKFARTKMYWPRVILRYLYALLVLVAMLWATIEGILGQMQPNWRVVGIVWVVIAALIIWSVYRSKRSRENRLAQLNSTLPERITLAPDGVKLNGPGGAAGFIPWEHFKLWREDRRVILIDEAQSNRAVLLPAAQLSEADRISLRQFLNAHLQPSPAGSFASSTLPGRPAPLGSVAYSLPNVGPGPAPGVKRVLMVISWLGCRFTSVVNS